MRDLLIVVPTRGRPAEAARLAAACAALCRTDYRLVFGIDDDDPAGGQYPASSDGAEYVSGPRRSLSAWTNAIARTRWGEYRALCSIGDDHVPLTPGWDGLLLTAAMRDGGGFAYPDDRLQGENLPTACVAAAPLVTALGWLMLPALRHYFVDNVWLDLGRAAKCLAYVPEAVVEHRHHLVTGQQDATYSEAWAGMPADQAAYENWRRSAMPADVAKIEQAREAAA